MKKDSISKNNNINNNLSGFIGNKYKMSVTVSTLPWEMKALVIIQEHCLSLKITDVFGKSAEEKQKKKEVVKSVLYPIYEADDTFYINYSLYKKVSIESGKLILEVFNPVLQSNFNIVMFKIDQVGLIFNKSLNYEGIVVLSKCLNNIVQQETKYLIEQFLTFFNFLKDGLSNVNIGRGLNEKLYKSLYASRKYYDKTMNELKKLDKLKNKVRKKITSSSNEVKKFNVGNKSNNRSIDKSIERSRNKSGVVEEINKEKSLNDFFGKGTSPGEEFTLQMEINDYIETVMQENNDTVYYSFDFVVNEIKLKALQMIEESIALFFQIVNLEFNFINLKKVNKQVVSNQLKNIDKIGNKSILHNKSINESIHCKTNSNYDENEHIFNTYSSSAIPNRRQRSHSQNITDAILIKNIDEKEKDMFSNKSMSTKTNSLKDSDKDKGGMNRSTNAGIGVYTNKDNIVLETPKFCGKNYNAYNSIVGKRNSENNMGVISKNTDFYTEERGENCNYNTMGVLNTTNSNSNPNSMNYHITLKNIELAKTFHSFLPPNSFQNIIQNTLEVTHRKFFEYCFEDSFYRMFATEKDAFNLLKLDSLFNFFLYLRGLKNMLFTGKNKVHFSNIFFTNEDL